MPLFDTSVGDPQAEAAVVYPDRGINPADVFKQTMAAQSRRKLAAEEERRNAIKEIASINANGYISHQVELKARYDDLLKTTTDTLKKFSGRSYREFNPNDKAEVEQYTTIQQKRKELEQAVNVSKQFQIWSNDTDKKLNDRNVTWLPSSVKDIRKMKALPLNDAMQYYNDNQGFPDLEQQHDWENDMYKTGKQLGYNLTSVEEENKTTVDKQTADSALETATVGYLDGPSGRQFTREKTAEGWTPEKITSEVKRHIKATLKTEHRILMDEPRTPSGASRTEAANRQELESGYQEGQSIKVNKVLTDTQGNPYTYETKDEKGKLTGKRDVRTQTVDEPSLLSKTFTKTIPVSSKAVSKDMIRLNRGIGIEKVNNFSGPAGEAHIIKVAGVYTPIVPMRTENGFDFLMPLWDLNNTALLKAGVDPDVFYQKADEANGGSSDYLTQYGTGKKKAATTKAQATPFVFPGGKKIF